MEENTSRISNIIKYPGLFCLFISEVVDIIGLVLRLVASSSEIADIDPCVLCVCANLQKMKEGIISFSFCAPPLMNFPSVGPTLLSKLIFTFYDKGNRNKDSSGIFSFSCERRTLVVRTKDAI